MSVSLLGCRGCQKGPAAQENADEERSARKPRVEVTIGLGSIPALPADAIIVDPRSPPTKPQSFERSGITVVVVGIPEGDAAVLMKAEVAAAYAAGASALVFVTTRCLAEIQLILTKDIAGFWTVPLVIGARCDGDAVQPNIGAAALVAAGTASRVTITFERTTRAFLKVQPLP